MKQVYCVRQITNNYLRTAPLAYLLGITFLVLKLCKVIAWSWWWVTLPFWAAIALVIAIAAACVVIVAMALGAYLLWQWMSDPREKDRRK